jgi:lipopolysaccharide export system protein LptA
VQKFHLLLLLFLFPLTLLAQERTKIYVDRFDKSRIDVKNNVSYLRKPTFRQDNAILTCDSAVFYEKKNVFEAFNNVHINQADTVNIFSDHLIYDGNTKIAHLTSNVRLLDRESVLTTNVLDYNMASKIGTYVSGGKIVNKDVTLTSKNGYYFANTRDAYFRYNVVVVTPETVIKSDTLRYNTLTNWTYFYGPTNIKGKTDNLYTENGAYNTKTQYAYFGKKNLYTQGSKSLKGDSLYYDGIAGYGKAVRNIVSMDTVDKFVMHGQLGYYYKIDQRTLVTKNAYFGLGTDDSITVKNVKQRDTLWLGADTLETQVVLRQTLKIIPGPIILKDNEVGSEKTDSTQATVPKNAGKAAGKATGVAAKVSTASDKNADQKNTKKGKDNKDAPDPESRPVLNKDSLAIDSSLTKNKDSLANILFLVKNKDQLLKILGSVKDKDALKQAKKLFKGKDSLLRDPSSIKKATELLNNPIVKSVTDSLVKKAQNDVKIAGPGKISVSSIKDSLQQAIATPAKRDAVLKAIGIPAKKDSLQKAIVVPAKKNALQKKSAVTAKKDSLAGKDQATVGKASDNAKKLVAGKKLTAAVSKKTKDSVKINPLDTVTARIIKAYHKVNVYKSNMQAKADSLFYTSADSTLRWFYNPIMWSDGTQQTGDTIYLQMKNKKLNTVQVIEKAFTVNVYKDSTRFNQIKGKKITGFFKNGKMNSMYVDGNAESIYFTKDDDGKAYKEMNQTVSSRIKISFKDSEIQDVLTIKDPDGAITPIDKVKEEVLLTGFQWKPEIRPLSKYQVIHPKAIQKAKPSKTLVKGKPGAVKTPAKKGATAKKTTDISNLTDEAIDIVDSLDTEDDVPSGIKDTALKALPGLINKADSLIKKQTPLKKQ